MARIAAAGWRRLLETVVSSFIRKFTSYRDPRRKPSRRCCKSIADQSLPLLKVNIPRQSSCTFNFEPLKALPLSASRVRARTEIALPRKRSLRYCSKHSLR